MSVSYDPKPGTPGFFSIKRSMKLGGVPFHPAVCYEITKLLAGTVEKLVADGLAVYYNTRVVFVNGVPRDLGKTPGRPMSTQLTPASAQWEHASVEPEGEEF